MKQEAAYGLKSCDLLAVYDQNTSSWKTSQTCLVGLATNEADGLDEFCQTWPRSGMMRSGMLYRLPELARYKTETEFGLLPTLAKTENKDFSRGSVLAKLDKGGRVARRICRKSSLIHSEEICGLNPSFAEDVAGYPIGWTELEPAETQ